LFFEPLVAGDASDILLDIAPFFSPALHRIRNPMAKSKPQLPPELQQFIEHDHTTIHCEDGDWDLLIQRGEDSDFKDDVPARSTVIAENGCGDCLFLKTSTAGKIDPRVFVYWHEEERDEVFAKSIREMIADSEKHRPAAEPTKAKPAAKKTASLKDLEKALASPHSLKRSEAMQEFRESEFGLDALPLLRRALADDYVSTVLLAAECIAELGPEAATCPAGEESMPVANSHVDHDDLMSQLMLRGGQVWSYSGYANCYAACLDALVKLEYDPDILCEFVQTHVGLSPDDLIHSLEALQAVGTADAHELAERAAAFWMSELNMSQAKKAKAILASFGSPKKSKKKK
jgi:hypothetical protein